jgi:hypothetical protein
MGFVWADHTPVLGERGSFAADPPVRQGLFDFHNNCFPAGQGKIISLYKKAAPGRLFAKAAARQAAATIAAPENKKKEKSDEKSFLRLCVLRHGP